MNIFRPLFEQSSCMCLALLIHKYLCLLVADSVGENPFKQSSHSQTHNVIPSPMFLSGPSVSSVISASENLTSSSAPKIHHLSQISVYCPQSDWPESTDFNVFTDAIFANLVQQSTPITTPSHPTYCSQSEWSELNDFQLFIETTILAQVPQSDPTEYLLPEWFKSNNIRPNKAPANLTQPSFSKFSSFPLDFTGCQQPDCPEVSSLQCSYVNLLNESSNVYQSDQSASSVYWTLIL